MLDRQQGRSETAAIRAGSAEHCRGERPSGPGTTDIADELGKSHFGSEETGWDGTKQATEGRGKSQLFSDVGSEGGTERQAGAEGGE